MSSVDNRNKIRIDSDSRKVLASIKRKNGIKTDTEAVNLAIRIAGTQMHIADVNETNELLHQLLDNSHFLKSISENTERNENILIRTFSYMRKMIAEMDEKQGTGWLNAAENDFKRHLEAKKNKREDG